FDPMFVYAEFSYWLGLEAGVGIDGVGSFEIFSAQALLNGGVRTPNPTMLWVRGEVSYSLLGGIVSGDWAMRFVWGEETSIQQETTWPCFEVFDPQDTAENFNIGKPLKGVMTTPVNRTITYQDEKGNDLDVKVLLREFNVYCTTCFGPTNPPPIPGEIVWNSSHIAFTFEPDYFLEPNQSYAVEAKATADGSVLVSGTYTEEVSFRFTTGDFPSSIDLMVKQSYPRAGRRYCYTGYPIQVEFNRALPVLDSKNIEARLVTEDGTEVSGVYTLAADYRSLQFVPDGTLAPNTFYEFKLVNPLLSGSTKPATDTTTAEAPNPAAQATSTADVSGLTGELSEELYLTQLADAMGETWLSIKFETGSYSGLKAMLEASNLQTVVSRPKVYSETTLDTLRNAPSYTVAFTTVEPFYWDELDLNVMTQNDRPTDCCEIYFEKEERPARPNQQPVEVTVEAPTTNDYNIYEDPASGFYGADCTTTVDGFRDITRSASEIISPRVLQQETGQRQALRLDVRYGPLEVIRHDIDPNPDCDFDVRQWQLDMNSLYYVGPRDVDETCRSCLNEKLVAGSQIRLAHRANQVESTRWFVLDIELPEFPTEPDPVPDFGGVPELVDTRPQEFEVD
ncbi:hypothetical protein KAI46_05815, partial [bacterium]|nr:hypothetical protein [bacterium]